MITTDDAELAARPRRLREHGMSVSAADRHTPGKPILEQYLETGFNYRMTDVQAAIGIVQLGRLRGLVAQRRSMAARYHELLAGVPGLRAVRDPAYGTTNYQAFWVLLANEVPVSTATTCWPPSRRPVCPPGAASWRRTWNRPTRAPSTCRCR